MSGQVDAFSPEPFGGNPAAVCLLQQSIDASEMQQIAAEVNLSETAFVEPAKTSGDTSRDAFATEACFGLRWFTPAKEAELCGHATLASAAVLFQGVQTPNTSQHYLQPTTRVSLVLATARASECLINKDALCKILSTEQSVLSHCMPLCCNAHHRLPTGPVSLRP